ncbi:MAG: gamma-glutamylcyclotransferase, partial [Phycisphaerae bacterium]|nr:gamma-glutamylcyclotransferase [Phycisphaerae bacterium]
MAAKTFNLFVYGTFMDRRLFRWVTGRDYALTSQPQAATSALRAREAILASHRKISPDGMYLYAIPQRRHRISGYLIYALPNELLELLDHYEGKRYIRTKVRVHQEAHRIRAFTFLANEKALRRDFGDRFRINLKHEHLITKRVEAFLAERAAKSADSALLPRYRVASEEELRGQTIRDLIRARLESGSLADYFLKRELSRPLASIRDLSKDPLAQPYIRNYLDLVVRQVLFNQTEQKFLEQFRFDLDHMGLSLRFYEHTTSSMAALTMLNRRKSLLDKLVHELLNDFNPNRHDLLHIVAWAIHAAESLYDSKMANGIFRWIRENLEGGLLPLGA